MKLVHNTVLQHYPRIVSQFTNSITILPPVASSSST